MNLLPELRDKMWSTIWLFCSLIVLALVSSARSNSQQKNFGPVWVTGCHAIQILCLSRYIKFFPSGEPMQKRYRPRPQQVNGKNHVDCRTLLASKSVCSWWLYSTYMYLHFNLLSGQWWLLTLNHLDDMDILQKDRSKTLIPARKSTSNIVHPFLWSHHRPLGSMTKLKGRSRDICYLVRKIGL